MTIVINDPALIAELEAASGSVELTDPSGRRLATVTAGGGLPPGVQSPFTDDEIERRRLTYPSGKSSEEILKRLRGA